MDEIQGFQDRMCKQMTGLTDNVIQKYRESTEKAKKHVESEVRRVLEIKIKQLLRRARRASRKSIVNPHMF